MARRGFVRRSCLRDALQRKTDVALRSRLANLRLYVFTAYPKLPLRQLVRDVSREVSVAS